MIYIIGTSHRLQIWSDALRNGEVYGLTRDNVEAFERYLRGVATSLRADVIAEELNDDAIRLCNPGASSVAQGIAVSLGIKHIFCEPDMEERRALGVWDTPEFRALVIKAMAEEPSRRLEEVRDELLKQQFPVRERYWIERLRACEPSEKAIVFVCGADHVDSFKERLEAQGNAASIVCRDWTAGA